MRTGSTCQYVDAQRSTNASTSESFMVSPQKGWSFTSPISSYNNKKGRVTTQNAQATRKGRPAKFNVCSRRPRRLGYSSGAGEHIELLHDPLVTLQRWQASRLR